MYSFAGIVCTEEQYEEFYLDTQQLWLLYYEQMRNISLLNYYEDLTDDYFDLVYDLESESYDSIIFNQDTVVSIDIEAEDKVNYVFMVVVRYYLVTNLYDEVFTSISTVIQGNVYRRAGYALGFTLMGAGVVSLGFSIYSLATYSSEVEIKRYNEQIAIYETKNNNLDIKETEEKN
jgi:hypothetical protein